MPALDAILTVVKEWIVKAENDLKNAAHTLTMGKNAPTDTICFHSQQCVEKYLKAFLVFRSTPFPKTHDLRVLVTLIPKSSRPKLESTVQDRLTTYATVTRYPGAGLDIPLTEARQAVAIARRIRRDMRRLLPRAALQQRRK